MKEHFNKRTTYTLLIVMLPHMNECRCLADTNVTPKRYYFKEKCLFFLINVLKIIFVFFKYKNTKTHEVN